MKDKILVLIDEPTEGFREASYGITILREFTMLYPQGFTLMSFIYSEGKKGDHPGVMWEDIEKAVKKHDVIYFDYGGLYSTGGLIDFWNREFTKLIENHPSKRWHCFSLIDTFEYEDKKRLEELGVVFDIGLKEASKDLYPDEPKGKLKSPVRGIRNRDDKKNADNRD